MLLRRTAAAAAVVFHRTFAKTSLHFFSICTVTASKHFANIPSQYRSRAIRQLQEALLDYLQSTRSLPFVYADKISRNSPQSLSNAVSKIPYSQTDFVRRFQRFLRYHPINELEFLMESIGLNCEKIENAADVFPEIALFISDWNRFDVVCALAGMGFPWRKLGLMCRENFSIFEVDLEELRRRIGEIRDCGFNGVTVISMGLSFPQVLYSSSDGLLNDLKILLLDYDLLASVDENVDDVLEVCEKIKLFYDLGCEMGKIGEMMGRSKSIFIEYSKDHLVGKIEYFCRLNVPRDEVGLFLLSRPEIFGFDIGDQVISVSGFLSHFGMDEEELKSLKKEYPHVFGRNILANVPCVMKAMDIAEWFFVRMKIGDPSLLSSYMISSDQDLDKAYEEHLEKFQSKKTKVYTKTKLDFIHSLGFGQNVYAIRALDEMHSCSTKLQQRFDFFLDRGIKYSILCSMLKNSALILNQNSSKIEQKLEFLYTEIGGSVQDLVAFPGYLWCDLEKRIKPRFRFHKWAMEQGYCKINYSLSTIMAPSDEQFLARASRMHPAAAKMWQEKMDNFQGALLDNISRNSLQCLSKAVSKIPYSHSNYVRLFQQFLRYHPIYELEFFLESMDWIVIRLEMPLTFFLKMCSSFLIGTVSLGLMCRENFSIFEVDPLDLKRRIEEIRDCGFNGVTVISIGLAFPEALYSNADGLLNSLKILLLEHDLLASVDDNLDAVLEVCEKIKLFYDLGCEMVKVGEMMGRSKSIFLEFSKEQLTSKIEYFCRLNVPRDEVGLFLLSRPDIFGFDLGDQVISVSGFLSHFGMEEEELKSLEKEYPHVFGRNILANVPCAMRAMDIAEWFFERMKKGDLSLLASYMMSSNQDLDKIYEENMRKLQLQKTKVYMKTKLDFIHSLGFGQNRFAIRALIEMQGCTSKSQQRFDSFLGCGIKYSILCSILKSAPQILNLKLREAEQKLEFLCTEMGGSVQDLVAFPRYLQKNLEKRIKPRFRFHKWAVEQGYCKINYSLSTIIGASDKQFLALVSRMHPAATKMWQEKMGNFQV